MGEYLHTIDNKGRLILPAKFRDELGEKFIATKGFDNCLFVYSPAEWANLENKLRQAPSTKGDARAVARFFFGGAAELEADKQGRVLIPANLRDYAKLDKDVVVVGVSTRIELWDKAAWDEYNAKISSDVTTIAENLVDLGI